MDAFPKEKQMYLSNLRLVLFELVDFDLTLITVSFLIHQTG
jgi:hypothetical protein